MRSPPWPSSLAPRWTLAPLPPGSLATSLPPPPAQALFPTQTGHEARPQCEPWLSWASPSASRKVTQ